MKTPNLTSSFLIIPHATNIDNATPVVCGDIDGFVRDWMPKGKGYAAAIRRVLQYESSSKYPYSTSQKVGPYCFYPLSEPIEPMTSTPLKTSTSQDARTLGHYLKMLSPDQVAQALLLIESGANDSSTGIETAIRYAQSCIKPVEYPSETEDMAA